MFVVPVNAGLFCNKLFVCSIYSIFSAQQNREISFARYGGDYSASIFQFLDQNKLKIVDVEDDKYSIYPEIMSLSCSNNEYLQCKNAANFVVDNLDLVFKEEVINQEPIEGIFVHMRLGDLGSQFQLGMDYYESALRKVYSEIAMSDRPKISPFKKYVTSNEVHSDTVKNFAKEFDFEIYYAKKEETLKFGSRFTNKILSHGSYSWFIGALGCKNNIVYPAFYEDKTWHDPTFYEVDGWKPVYYRN